MSWAALAAGLVDLGLAAFLAFLPRLAGWNRRLLASGSVNAATTRVLHLGTLYVVALTGLALLFAGNGWIALAAAGFWAFMAGLVAVQIRLRDPRAIALFAALDVAALLHLLAAWSLLG